MSSDDRMLVLVTKRRDQKPGLEYRVAWVQASENLFAAPDYPSLAHARINRAWVLAVCERASLFLEEKEALAYAHSKEQELGGCEYGLWVQRFPTMYFPARNDQRRNRSRRNRAYSQRLQMVSSSPSNA